MSRVYVERFQPPAGPAAALSRALEWVNAASFIRSDSRVFIKPNLTWKRHIPGVTVTPGFIEEVVRAILPLTAHITIGESEGGQECFQAEEAFESHGLYALRDRFKIRVVNLSDEPTERILTEVSGRSIEVTLPRLLTRETDVFVTLPVPKMHAMTRVSLGLKNQWGCLGNSMRVTSHPTFDHSIVAINRILSPRLCIFDGTFFLNQTGPMTGEAVPQNMIIVGDDVCAASDVCCRVMKVDPMSIAHHRVAAQDGMWPAPDSIQINASLDAFATRQFRLRRSIVNYIQLAAFKLRGLNRLFYDSIAADFLHQVLWTIRRNPRIRNLLYGPYGPGEANRGGKEM